MKAIKLLPLLLFILGSCSSIHVNSDFDKMLILLNIKPMLKSGIDKAEISNQIKNESCVPLIWN
jgi:uncharacterized protein YcfL